MTRRVSKEEFQKRLDDKYGVGTYIIKVYSGTNHLAKITHKCGYTWDIEPCNLMSRERCPKCSGTMPVTIEELNKRNIKKHFVVISKESNNMVLHCLVCGNEWKGSLENFGYGKHGCPKCKGDDASLRQKKTNEQFLQDVTDTWGNRYTPLDKYINSRVKIRVRCNNCLGVWEIKPNDLLNGHGCPRCNVNSAGEKILYNILFYNNIKFEYQYAYNYKNTILHYDFYLPENKLFIEYDGLQHYDKNNFFWSDAVHKYDSVKNKHAIESGNSIIRIPYGISNYQNVVKSIKENLNLDLEIPPTPYLLKDIYDFRDVFKYSETHLYKDVLTHFNMSNGKINRIFRLAGYKHYTDFKKHLV